MNTDQIQIGFSNTKEIKEDFLQFSGIISDRGSRYAVSGGKVNNREEVKAFLKQLKTKKKYAKATHNTWAVRVLKDGKIFEVKNDDGETGAGNVILRQIRAADCVNTIVVVTRWYGGVKLHGDRFKHVQDATKYFLKKI